MSTSSPPFSERLITTPQQEKAFSNIFHYTLTVIAAPEGYGKASLARKFIEREDVKLVWLRLFWGQESDQSFWNELILTVGKLSTSIAARLEKLKYPESEEDCAKVVSLMEELGTFEHIILVLEDFDRIETPKIDKLLQFMLLSASNRFHIVVISQSIPLLYADGYLLPTKCNFIGKDILQFDEELTTCLAASLDKQYKTGDLSWLVEYAGGWPDLIYYILSQSRNKILNHYHYNVSSRSQQMYRIAFSQQLDLHMRDILLVLCELEQFSLETAIEILDKYEDTSTIEQWLDKLAAETVFISKQEDGYVMSPSAIEFLREESPKSPSLIVRIGIQNIAQQYLRNGNAVGAVTLLNLHEDIDGLLNLLDKNVIEEFSDPIITALSQIVKHIRPPQMMIHPVAICQIAFILVKTDLYTQTGIRLLEELRAHTLNSEETAYDRDFILGQIELTLGSRQGEHIRSKGLIRLTSASLKGNNAIHSTWIAPSLLCSVHSSVGNMVAEVAAFQSLCRTGEDGDYLSPMKCANIMQAEYQLETGYPSKAIYHALESITDSDRKSTSLFSLYSYYIIAKASLMNGDFSKAEDLADNIALMFCHSHDTRISSLSDICRGYIYTCLGKWEKVPEWIYKEDGNRLSQLSSYAYIIVSRKLIQQGDFIDFEMMSKKWFTTLKRSNNILAEIHYWVHKVISSNALYGISHTVTDLKAALSLALPDEIIAPFAENGEKLLPVLQYAISHKLIELPQAYSNRLSSLISNLTHQPTDITSIATTLTRREKEILSLLYEGMNCREIADRLVISQFTVRKHIQNIYAKLNVNDRVNALIRGKEILPNSEL